MARSDPPLGGGKPDSSGQHCDNPLTLPEIEARLPQISGWHVSGDGSRLQKSLRVNNFLSAIRLFERIADIAEKLDHHPDLHLESYRYVRIEIWTHRVAGLTERDFCLASEIDKILQQFL